MQQIGRDEVRRLVDDRGAVLAEVLPRSEFEFVHLPGAVHLPLQNWDPDRLRTVLDTGVPVVAYCNDFQ